ncbi:MAG: hypothetical protein HRU77_01545 [Gammaproteobacteria bacterium]|nr:MAG: hypothetical protein HRU77_01545 [Gammaproteobacteria bacterium]
MAKMVKIIYVGKKPSAFDNVARSGKTWAGNGDIQEVTKEQAAILLKYPDQWAKMEEPPEQQDENGGYNDGGDGNDNGNDDDGNQDDGQSNTVDTSIPLEKMTKDELIVLAKAKYGKDLPETMTKKQLIDELEALKADLG